MLYYVPMRMPAHTQRLAIVLFFPLLISCMPAPTVFSIESSAFADGEMIPAEYTCDGVGTPPPLSIHNVPEGTKSLALLVEDPDAPGKTYTHWLVWNIDPANATLLAVGQKVPTGAMEGKNDAGTIGYVSPCPPSGVHRYNFRLYATDQVLPMQPGATIQDFYQAIEKVQVLGRARMTGKYKRS